MGSKPCSPGVRRTSRDYSHCAVQWSVSPHPDPLPQGEGTARFAQWEAESSGLFSARSRVHPLPEGEGWGEGKWRERPLAYRIIPGIVELDESSVFPNHIESAAQLVIPLSVGIWYFNL